jgi:hypothetical protein
MLRVLVTVTPQMYRQAIALSLRRKRPGVEVRIASPEDSGGELAIFRPHLLVHNDNNGLRPEDLASVLFRITVLYSNGMDAHIVADGEVSEAIDISTEDLFRVVDAAIAMAER